MESCPMHCINASCKDTSFLEKHETFVLTIIGLGGSAVGVMLAYFLKSRCKKIKCCFGLFSCDRIPIDLPIESADVTVESSNA